MFVRLQDVEETGWKSTVVPQRSDYGIGEGEGLETYTVLGVLYACI